MKVIYTWRPLQTLSRISRAYQTFMFTWVCAQVIKCGYAEARKTERVCERSVLAGWR